MNMKHILVNAEDITVNTVVTACINSWKYKGTRSRPPRIIGTEEGQTKEEASGESEETEEASGERGETNGMHLC